MKLFNGGFKMGSGVLVGAGVILVAPVVIPVVATLVKSLTKATIKGSLIAYHKAKIATAETMESLEDLAAEAKAEISEKTEAAE